MLVMRKEVGGGGDYVVGSNRSNPERSDKIWKVSCAAVGQTCVFRHAPSVAEQTGYKRCFSFAAIRAECETTAWRCLVDVFWYSREGPARMHHSFNTTSSNVCSEQTYREPNGYRAHSPSILSGQKAHSAEKLPDSKSLKDLDQHAHPFVSIDGAYESICSSLPNSAVSFLIRPAHPPFARYGMQMTLFGV